MGRTRRRAAAALGVAALGGLLQAGPAGAEQTTAQFTFTHTSGQRVTCTWVYGVFDGRDDENGGTATYTAFTFIESDDPRCEAEVDAALGYTDTYGNDQIVSAVGLNRVSVKARRVRDHITSSHGVFFMQCGERDFANCQTGVVINRK
jgi:hypothetical protein